MTQTLTLRRPDDWHLHLRDGAGLAAVVAHTAERFGRAICMPNLAPPVVTTEQALAYRARILEALPKGADFEPLMTLYLTESTRPEEIFVAKESGRVQGVKLYPAGATTHSEAGVRDVTRVQPVLEAMAEADLPLLVHGEVTDPAVDVFDREKVFIDRVLLGLLERCPDLRVVFEHITTRDAVQFVLGAPGRVAATLTPQHLLMDRGALFEGGLRPHHYCLPVLKRREHREALLEAATSGDPRFFLGTDSAPHARETKQAERCCAGMYSSHAGIELYAEAFESAGALDRLEGFASFHGPDFYGLPRNTERIVLLKESWSPPQDYPFGDSSVQPMRAGESIAWRLERP